jgi:hypothetical protein
MLLNNYFARIKGRDHLERAISSNLNFKAAAEKKRIAGRGRPEFISGPRAGGSSRKRLGISIRGKQKTLHEFFRIYSGDVTNPILDFHFGVVGSIDISRKWFFPPPRILK